MATASLIRDRLASYLAGEIALDQFDQWLTANTWNIHQTGERDAERLAYAIELRLAEHSSGHLAANELKRELLHFVDRYTLEFGPSRVVTRSTDQHFEFPALVA